MAGALPHSDSGHDRPVSDINVTPFVDVVLVLLVIFMITAPTLLKDVINVKLPKAVSSDSKSATSLGVAVTKQGQFLVNGELVSQEVLAQRASLAVRAQPETQAIISADEDARHADVVRAIDTLKNAGLERFAIQIDHQK